MVVEVFNCAAKITGGKMAVILGTAVAITAFSACIAPLLHCPDDDDNEIEESKKTLIRTTRSVQRPQSSLMTIFLNGLRKIGIIAPSESDKNPEKECESSLAKRNTLRTCFPPVVPVVEISRTSRDVPVNVQEPMRHSLAHPKEDFDPRKMMQCVNINVVLPRSNQSTQTEDDYLSALESTRASHAARIHVAPAAVPKSSDMGTQADPLMTEGRSALPNPCKEPSSQASSLLTDESTTSSVAPKADSSSVIQTITDQQELKMSDPGISKPPRAHPPTQITTAIVHRDASLTSNQIQTLSRSRSAGGFEIRTTPTGRFHDVPLPQNHSFMRCSSSTLEPPSATRYPLHLPAPKSSRIQESRQSEKKSSDSSSLAGRMIRSCKSFQTAKSRNSGREARPTEVQTYPSDHWSRSRRIYLAEASRPNGMIHDLENESRTEHYSNSEIMSSTRVLNASTASITQNNPKRPQEFSKDPTAFPHNLAHGDNQEAVEKRWNKYMDNIIRNINILSQKHESLARNDNENIINEGSKQPSKPPEVLLCHNPTNSRTSISDFRENLRDLSKEKRGIGDWVRDIFRRRGKRKYQNGFQESDTTFERPLRWNLMRPQQSSSL